jgi:ABC-type branched-subunit amino acid transport system ATPase component/ABC-type branched-subunit amino acid transport system permease subunit
MRALSVPQHWSLTGAGTALLCVVCVVPLISGDTYLVYISSLTAVYALAAVGLNIVHGFSGQISLGHGSLVAIGAYVTAILTVNHGWSVLATLVPAVLAVVVAAAVMSLPSLRLSRWYLAVITMAFALAIGGVINSDQSLTGGGNGLFGIPGLSLFGHVVGATGMYLVLLALVAIALVCSRNLRRSPRGLAMIAVRDSELVAQSVAVSVSKTKVWAFAISGIPVGLAGVLWASMGGVVSPGQFDISYSVLLFLIVLIGGDGRIVGPVLGAIMMQLLPQILTSFEQYQLIVYAALLLTVAILAPEGLVGIGTSLAGRLQSSFGPWLQTHRFAGLVRHASQREALTPDGAVDLVGSTAEASDGASVSIEELSRSFGGVRALNEVSMSVPPGSAVGLIGPNGSGKTTLLNLISGLYPPSEGRVVFDGEVLNGKRPAERAALGIARTFQTPRLLDREDVLSNVILGASRLRRRSVLPWLVRLPSVRREEALYEQRAIEWLTRFGIADLSRQVAGDLSHGDKRLVELVRAMMSKPRLLLLDEPSSGLGAAEVTRLRDAILALSATGLTIVLVEHHIGLVRAIASEIGILDQGVMIANGPALDVLNDRAVVNAYLGIVMSGADQAAVNLPTDSQVGDERS